MFCGQREHKSRSNDDAGVSRASSFWLSGTRLAAAHVSILVPAERTRANKSRVCIPPGRAASLPAAGVNPKAKAPLAGNGSGAFVYPDGSLEQQKAPRAFLRARLFECVGGVLRIPLSRSALPRCCPWQDWQRPTLPRLEPQYHGRWEL